MDFLLSRPEVDSQRIFACGTSQGGGLTLITTALRPEIKGAVSGYTFLCCFPESMNMLHSYPYDELTCYARANPQRVPQMFETLRYYDAMNFAGWIKCPTVGGIGLEDEVCPPETSYAVYAALGGQRNYGCFRTPVMPTPTNFRAKNRLGWSVRFSSLRPRRPRMTSAQRAFDAFWGSVDRDAASVPLDIALEQDIFYSQPEWDVYRMRYSGQDGYRLFAWLSIPKRLTGEKVPGVIRMPDYASVHDLIYTPLRHHALVMNATHPGSKKQR